MKPLTAVLGEQKWIQLKFLLLPKYPDFFVIEIENPDLT